MFTICICPKISIHKVLHLLNQRMHFRLSDFCILYFYFIFVHVSIKTLVIQIVRDKIIIRITAIILRMCSN